MALLPDEAIGELYTLTQAEIIVFSYYCKTRNNQLGGWKCPDADVATAVHLGRSTVCKARNSLIKNGWVSMGAEWFITPLKGFVKPVPVGTEPVPVGTEPVPVGTEPVPVGTEPVPVGTETSSSGNCIYTIPCTSHDQPFTSPLMHAGAHAHARGGEFTPSELALLAILGWGLAPNAQKGEQVRMAVAELAGLADHYGADYAPLPERIARFPDYANARMSTWSLRAVVNHWKRFVDSLNSQQADTPEAQQQRVLKLLRERKGRTQ